MRQLLVIATALCATSVIAIDKNEQQALRAAFPGGFLRADKVTPEQQLHKVRDEAAYWLGNATVKLDKLNATVHEFTTALDERIGNLTRIRDDAAAAGKTAKRAAEKEQEKVAAALAEYEAAVKAAGHDTTSIAAAGVKKDATKEAIHIARAGYLAAQRDAEQRKQDAANAAQRLTELRKSKAPAAIAAYQAAKKDFDDHKAKWAAAVKAAEAEVAAAAAAATAEAAAIKQA